MSRLRSLQGIILRKYRIGDIHKGLVVLTDTEGLVRVIAHGAFKPRSRLAGSSEPLTHVAMGLYHDPVKDTYKVTDLNVLDGFELIKSDARTFATASSWCECFIMSHGAGQNDREPFELLLRGLSALSECDSTRVVYADLQFSWRLLGILGYRPSDGSCPGCGAAVATGQELYLRTGQRAFSCGRCTHDTFGGDTVVVEPGALSYLRRTAELSLEQALRIGLESSGATRLQTALHRILEAVLEGEIKALRVHAALGGAALA